MTESPHQLINPPGLAPPVGFAHTVVPVEGRAVFLGGQTAHQGDGSLAGETLAEQFAAAARNVVAALAAGDADPSHLVSLHVYVTDVAAYRASLGPIGEAYRAAFGRHYPAMALFGVTELFDPAALVELVGIAVVPAGPSAVPVRPPVR